MNKKNHLYVGDCLEIMQDKIKPESVDMVFADPPYNLSGKGVNLIGNNTGGDFYTVDEEWDKMSESDYAEFTNKWIGICRALLKSNGSMYVCCTLHNMESVLSALRMTKMKVKNIITWQKTNAMPSVTKRVFTHSTEFVIYAVKNPKWTFNYEDLKRINPDRQKNGDLKQMRDVWSIPLVQGRERLHLPNGKALHPTQKPEELVKRTITASSNPGDLILDPFFGSGTTGVVARRLGRGWIGIERNPEYGKHALKRISDSQPISKKKRQQRSKDICLISAGQGV